MTLPLTSTCVGGRRALDCMPAITVVQREPKSPAVVLTKRQQQVIEAVIDTGYCTLAAVRLGISVKTLEIHMAHLRERYDVLSNYQLIAAYVAAQKG